MLVRDADVDERDLFGEGDDGGGEEGEDANASGGEYRGGYWY